MGYKGKYVRGEIPEGGAIFMSNIDTHKECLERKLFGLPAGMSNFVLHVKEGMTLFLFEFERRLLYGVFRATCDGGINIEPRAFRSSGKHFPAQVRFTTICDCSPLAEHEFKDVIRGNYYSGKKFNFGLNEKQVRKLTKLFRSKEVSRTHTERNIWRYDDKPSEKHARSGDLRKQIRNKIRFDSCDSRGDEVKEVDDNRYISKHIIESRHKDKQQRLLTNYTTENDEFGESGRHDILRKSLDLREKDIEDCYMPVFSKSDLREKVIDDGYMPVFTKPDFRAEDIEDGYMPVFSKPDFRAKDIEDGYIPVFSKPHGTHFDEIGLGSSDIIMECKNKDMIDYNRLQDEYNIREGLQRSLNEHTLTNHDFSRFNQNAYSNCDPTRTDVPSIQISSSCFNDGSSFIPIADNYLLYPSPERVPMSKSLLYYSHDEGSNRYLDGSQSSIFPKFISRNLSSDAGLCVHEVDPTDYYRSSDKHESKHSFGTNKRVSVFSRLSSTLRHEEQAYETDEKPEISSSADKVMRMLEKVVRSPKKRKGKNSSVIKQDDADNPPDRMIEDVSLEVDAEDEEVDEESAYQETRLVDFKRRKKSNKRIGDVSKENFECLGGTTSDVGPVANDQLTGTPHKRRKLLRPAFVKKSIIPGSVSAHENTIESSEKVGASIKVPSCHENKPDDGSSTKIASESSKQVDVSTKHSDENTLESSEKVDPSIKVPSCHEIKSDDGGSTKLASESSKQVDVSIRHSDENTLENSKKVDASIKVPSCHENKPDDSSSTKLASESSKQVDVLIKHSDENTLGSSKKVDASIKVPSCLENKPDDSSSTKSASESSKQVDVSIKRRDENKLFANVEADVAFGSSEKFDAFIKSMVPTFHEKIPDDGNSLTKAESESSTRVDVLMKIIDLNMLPASDESQSPKDDNNSTKVVLESRESGNRGDGNAEGRLLSDAFVERTVSKNDQKMCGWIDD